MEPTRSQAKVGKRVFLLQIGGGRFGGEGAPGIHGCDTLDILFSDGFPNITTVSWQVQKWTKPAPSADLLVMP